MDFIKIGPFVEALGGLKSPDTNQKMYRVMQDGEMKQIYLYPKVES